jgi:hypothetical protein
MPYVIRFIDPAGAVTYWPPGFGFTSHEHASTLEAAERFTDEIIAQRHLNGYVHPPAFWNSEREHAEKMHQQFRNWRYEVITLAQAQ